ncbi:glycosyltransferase [Eudoraea chungangensis]|uniref:glycosyltransferase n=1 Tax=Eudoraea chungangensis TaxID=1481905 RepID=UPI0023EB61F8
MLLSIIIPVYNVEKYLAKCLDSLLDQDLNKDEFEIIVVNDGSKDGSLEIANAYATKHSHIRIIDQENQGVGATRNNGLDSATGKYVYFLDPDDYVCTNSLSTLVDFAQRNKLEILCFKSKSTLEYGIMDPDSVIDPSIKVDVKTGLDFISSFQFKNEIWWYLIEREFLVKSKVRFILGRWMEDAIFTAYLFSKAASVAYVPWDIHRHVIVPQSAMTSREPAHYNRVIYDNANAAKVYGGLINELDKDTSEMTIKRLKCRQESFVFFLLGRAFQSNLSFSQINDILIEMKSLGAYPFKYLTEIDYKETKYKITSNVFNNKFLLKTAFKGYRLLNPN